MTSCKVSVQNIVQKVMPLDNIICSHINPQGLYRHPTTLHMKSCTTAVHTCLPPYCTDTDIVWFFMQCTRVCICTCITRRACILIKGHQYIDLYILRLEFAIIISILWTVHGIKGGDTPYKWNHPSSNYHYDFLHFLLYRHLTTCNVTAA